MVILNVLKRLTNFLYPLVTYLCYEERFVLTVASLLALLACTRISLLANTLALAALLT